MGSYIIQVLILPGRADYRGPPGMGSQSIVVYPTQSIESFDKSKSHKMIACQLIQRSSDLWISVLFPLIIPSWTD